MNPKFWGSHGWLFLHTVTMNYPKEPTNEDKTLYRNFFSSLKRVLPCEKCAYHYHQHIKDDPIEPALESRDTLVRWLIKIHNKVNDDLDKPNYTYEQVIEEYKYKMMNMDRDETLIYKVIIGALLLFILYKHFKK
tara:strand:- start:353 stop:757 length:405 start_codon:yes stop_codon:yes gene_type:complete